MKRTLLSVADFATQSPFTENQIRWWLFHRASNGLDNFGAIVKVGRRVYIDVAAFERWIDSQQHGKAAA